MSTIKLTYLLLSLTFVVLIRVRVPNLICPMLLSTMGTLIVFLVKARAT